MNKPLILVVEDDTPVRNLITTTLKTHEYRYLSAQNGASAVMEALSHNPDIVLLDLGLPDMDGVEIIRKIRAWSNMPIIVISARTEDSDKIVALDAGADDYLTKPFSVDELLARLRVTQRRLSLMKTDAAQESPIFTNGALKIDYAAGCAYLDGAELHLTPIEYKLLCLLSKNVGKVLTHTYITQQIWGSSWEKRYCFSAGVHGDPAQKAGTRKRRAAIYTNAHWNRLSDAPGRVIEHPGQIADDAADQHLLQPIRNAVQDEIHEVTSNPSSPSRCRKCGQFGALTVDHICKLGVLSTLGFFMAFHRVWRSAYSGGAWDGRMSEQITPPFLV